MNYPQIPVDQIDQSHLQDTKLPPNFMKSIEEVGITDPLLLVERASDSDCYRILPDGGVKRLICALELNYATVPAWTFPDDQEANNLRIIHSMEHRSDNILVAYMIVKQWQESGLDNQAIAKKMAVPITRVNHILILNDLLPDLRDEIGLKIGQTASFQAAKLSPFHQAKLVDLMQQNGKVRSKAVGEVRQVRAALHINRLPDRLFEPIDLPTEPHHTFAPEQEFIATATLLDAIAALTVESPEAEPYYTRLLNDLNLYKDEPH